MFENVEKKLKAYAKFNSVAVIIFAVIGVFALMSFAYDAGIRGAAALLMLLGFALLIYALLATCWFMYAFAEITESTKATNAALRLAFAQELTEEERRQQAEAQIKEAAAREAALQQAAQERAAQEAEEARKAERKRRYDAYWSAHADEWNALNAKKKEAQDALAAIGGTVCPERDQLEALVKSIDEELNRDR